MKTSVRFFHWLPRVICILAIIFISVFAADAFGPGRSFAEQLGDFFIHLVPSFILLIVLFIAWRWELTGGIIFLVLGLAISPFIYSINFERTQSVSVSLGAIMLVTVPFIIVGILFILSRNFKKKNSPDVPPLNDGTDF